MQMIISITLLVWLLVSSILMLLWNSEKSSYRTSKDSLSDLGDKKHFITHRTPLDNLSLTKLKEDIKNMSKYKSYRYSRGDKYSCIVTIINGDNVVFSNIKTPPTATSEVKAKMLDDAEEEALKLFNVDTSTQYSG